MQNCYSSSKSSFLINIHLRCKSLLYFFERTFNMAENTLLQLPLDILTNIFKYLPLNDLKNLMLTSITVRNLIVENSSLWRWICRNELIIENRLHSGYDNLLRYDASRISYNWRYGIYKTKQVLNLRIKFMPWIQLTPEVLLLSVGSELRCHLVDKYGVPISRQSWKVDVPSIKRYDVRTNDISRFVFRDKLLVCGNRDGSAAIYEINRLKKKPKLLQHIPNCHGDGEVEVSAIDVIYNSSTTYVLTGSSDCQQLVFWRWYGNNRVEDLYNTRPEEYTQIVFDNFKGVRSMALSESGDMLAIGPNGNNRPVLLDVNTLTIVSNIDDWKYDKRQVVRDIQWHDDNTIATVNHAGILELMDRRSQEVTYHVRDPFHSTLYCVKSDGNNAIVVGSAEYSRCVLFDRRCSNHVQLYFTQKQPSPVYSLDFNATKLVAAVDRGVATCDFDVFIESIEPRDYSQMFSTISTSYV